MRVQSFSIAPNDTSAMATIAKIKEHCNRTGVSFSHIVVSALIKYAQEVLWPQLKKPD